MPRVGAGSSPWDGGSWRHGTVLGTQGLFTCGDAARLKNFHVMSEHKIHPLERPRYCRTFKQRYAWLCVGENEQTKTNKRTTKHASFSKPCCLIWKAKAFWMLSRYGNHFSLTHYVSSQEFVSWDLQNRQHGRIRIWLSIYLPQIFSSIQTYLCNHWPRVHNTVQLFSFFLSRRNNQAPSIARPLILLSRKHSKLYGPIA